MIILDTNVLSALMRQTEQPRTSIWNTSVTVLEIRFGLQILAATKHRTAVLQVFTAISRSETLFSKNDLIPIRRTTVNNKPKCFNYTRCFAPARNRSAMVQIGNEVRGLHPNCWPQ